MADRGAWRETAARRAARLVAAIDAAISEKAAQIDQYHRAMDAELAALRDKKSYANNNLAGAAWQQSLSTEMEAAVGKYQAKIKTAQDAIDALRKDRADLLRQ